MIKVARAGMRMKINGRWATVKDVLYQDFQSTGEAQVLAQADGEDGWFYGTAEQWRIRKA